MASKTTLVRLVVRQFNLSQEFEMSHAERLLNMQNNGGWELPKDSKFELTENGIRIKPNKKRNRKQ